MDEQTIIPACDKQAGRSRFLFGEFKGVIKTLKTGESVSANINFAGIRNIIPFYLKQIKAELGIIRDLITHFHLVPQFELLTQKTDNDQHIRISNLENYKIKVSVICERKDKQVFKFKVTDNMLKSVVEQTWKAVTTLSNGIH